MYDARVFREILITPKRRTVAAQTRGKHNIDDDDDENNLSNINIYSDSNISSNSSSNGSNNPNNNNNNNGNDVCSIHFVLPRMAASLAMSLLIFASLTVVAFLRQESKYMMAMTAATKTKAASHLYHHLSSSSSSSSSSPSLTLYLHEKGQESVCSSYSSSESSRWVVEKLDPPLPTRHNWTDILEGPALGRKFNEQAAALDMNSTIIAACKFNVDNHSAHFPHALQQLYRCVSWWQYHRELFQELHKNNSSSSSNSSSGGSSSVPRKSSSSPSSSSSLALYLIWPKVAGTPRTTPFVKGFLNALRQTWQVRIVPLRGKVPVVRAKVQYGYPPPDKAVSYYHTHGGMGYQTRQVSDLQQLRRDMIPIIVPPQQPKQRKRIHSEPQKQQQKEEEQQQQMTATVRQQRKFKITILNRNVDSGRSILNAELLQQVLQEALGKDKSSSRVNGEVDGINASANKNNNSHALGAAESMIDIDVDIDLIPSMDNLTFIEQVQVMSRTNLLISPHGAQLSSLWLLPPCSAVLELFGRGYVCPEFFGSLAAASGIRYAHLYTAAAPLPTTTTTSSSLEEEANRTTATTTTTAVTGTSTGATTTGITHSSTTTTAMTRAQKIKAEEVAYWMKDFESRKVARLFPICAPISTIVDHVQTEFGIWKERMLLHNPGCFDDEPLAR